MLGNLKLDVLEKILSGLGFRKINHNYTIFTHPKTDALIILPRNCKNLKPYQINMVAKVLEENRIMRRKKFEKQADMLSKRYDRLSLNVDRLSA